MLPTYNARLTKIQAGAGGGVADGLDTNAAGTIRWEGDQDAYILIKKMRNYSGDTSQIAKEIVIYVPDHTARTAGLIVGDYLTIKQNGSSTTYRANDVVSSVGLDALGSVKVGVERA